MKLIKAHVEQDGRLDLTIEREAVPEWAAAERVRWQVRNAGGGAFRGAIRLQHDFPDGFRLPWIMVPGFLYGENRRVGKGAREDSYPRFDPASTHPARMASNWWDFAADRVSHALVYAFEEGQCFALASPPHVELSDGCLSDDWEPQVAVGFGCNGRGGYARITFPACEEPFTYAESTQSAATIRRVLIPPGGTVSGELFLIRFAGCRHDYQRVIEFYYRTVGAGYPTAGADDPLALMRDAVHGIVNWHYHEAKNYFVYSRVFDRVAEQIANARGITLEWHQMNTGFVSGLPVCWGLAVAARRLHDPRALDVARRVADRICREGLSPSGLFWADFKPGWVEERNGRFRNPLSAAGEDTWGSGWWKEAGCVHARTIADANYALANLSRWTGNDYYRQRADDHWRYAQQLLVRVDGQYNGFRGALAEQFYWSNWSSFGQDTRALEPGGFKGHWDPGPHHRQKGNLAAFSALWCINIVLLGAEMQMREG
jgi:hypothetical protein